MKLATLAVAALVLLALVACGSSAAAGDTLGGATSKVNTQVVADGEQVAALAQRVVELEARLAEPWWTEQDAIAVVQEKLNEAATYCARTGSGGSSTACLRYLDDLMKGMTTSVPAFLASTAAKAFSQDGEWSAIYEVDSLRWRVVRISQGSDGSSRVAFYAYERTGLVEGTVLTAEQLNEDHLRELERRNAVREGLGLPPVEN